MGVAISLVWKRAKEGFLRKGQLELFLRRGRLFYLGRRNSLNKKRSTDQLFVFPNASSLLPNSAY